MGVLVDTGRLLNKAILGQALPWLPTLRALDIQPPAIDAVPATVECPLCHNRLIILPDVRSGVWCRCYGCKWAGDLISLGMKLWQLDAFTVLRRLSSSGVIFPDRLLSRATVERYQEQVLDYRAGIKAFWETASRYPFQDNVEIRRLHDQFGLRSDYDPKRWMWQLGRFVGTTTTIEATRAIKMEDQENFPMGCLFKGIGWKDVMVIPSYDMPGRIAGFWFTGRDGGPKDWIYYWTDLFRVRAGWGSPKDEREAGLAFFDPDQIYHPLFHDTWFVTGDPAMALKLHGRYFRDHGDYLPFVLAYEGNEGYARRVWCALQKRDWVFWSPKPTREIFAQAQAASGRVCICPFDPELDLRRLITWLRQVKSKARPWREALIDQLQYISDAEVETILLHLDLDHQDAWNIFTKDLPDDARLRLNACRNRKWPTPVVHTGGVRLAVRPEGWFIEKTGELVTDVSITVDAAFSKRLAGKKRYAYYLITCRYRGYEWRLCKPTRDLRHSLPEFIEEYAITHNIPPPKFSPIWRSRLLDLALKLSNPVLKHTRSRGVVRQMKKAARKREAENAKAATDEKASTDRGTTE